MSTTEPITASGHSAARAAHRELAGIEALHGAWLVLSRRKPRADASPATAQVLMELGWDGTPGDSPACRASLLRLLKEEPLSLELGPDPRVEPEEPRSGDAERSEEDDPTGEAWCERSHWPRRITPRRFCILLSWGGPACRIVGEMRNGRPSRPEIQWQDWGTPWASLEGLTQAQQDAMQWFAREVLY